MFPSCDIVHVATARHSATLTPKRHIPRPHNCCLTSLPMRTFLQLSVDEHAVVCSQMDMRSLLTLRCSSKAALEAVAELLKHNLGVLCGQFVSNTSELLYVLPRIRAFIGGDVAVRFMLPEVDFPCHTLDVFVPQAELPAALYHFEQYQHAVETSVADVTDDPSDWLQRHAILSITTFHTRTGVVRVYESSCADALAPLACAASSSLQATYVNTHHFGTAFPALLFQHRGVVADWRDGETEEVIMWGRRGVDLRVSARAWPEFREAPCPRRYQVCHTTARSFIDFGAMRCRMMPTHKRALRSITWFRLDARPCGGVCLHDAGLLWASEKYSVQQLQQL